MYGREINAKFRPGSMKGKHRLEELVIDGIIIL